MNKILVTGATGFLGSRVVSELLNEGESPKLFVRDKDRLNSAFKDLDIFVGDLRDKNDVEKALEGCDKVIHVAGLVSLVPKDRDLLFEINYKASVNLFEAALQKKVKKFIYTSTSSCLGAYRFPDMKEKVESSKLNVPYVDSKNMAFKEAFNYYLKGLPIVIMCPTLILGDGDVHLTSSEIIYNFLKKKIPGYLSGGLNVVYVGDVALAHINALYWGKEGDVYVTAGTENMTLKEFFLTLEKLSGIKGPRIHLPTWLAKSIAYSNELISKKPIVPLGIVKMGELYWYFDSEKMKNELHVEPTSLNSTLNKSITWIRNEHLKNN